MGCKVVDGLVHASEVHCNGLLGNDNHTRETETPALYVWVGCEFPVAVSCHCCSASGWQADDEHQTFTWAKGYE